MRELANGPKSKPVSYSEASIRFPLNSIWVKNSNPPWPVLSPSELPTGFSFGHSGFYYAVNVHSLFAKATHQEQSHRAQFRRQEIEGGQSYKETNPFQCVEQKRFRTDGKESIWARIASRNSANWKLGFVSPSMIHGYLERI